MGEDEPAGEGVTAGDFVAAVTVGVAPFVAVSPDPAWLIARKKTSKSRRPPVPTKIPAIRKPTRGLRDGRRGAGGMGENVPGPCIPFAPAPHLWSGCGGNTTCGWKA